ncbi:hypothetical protein [Paenibacillus puerhi]|uniref:hypothetical protein n=1 Tax=Paenibacillus puerhi TaxID=2692622 RepID=UPI00135C6A3C|nr:hypothetical protein [Paenibacillus puerhi]
MDLIYIILGSIDIMVLLALMLQIFRWPFFRYWKGLLLIAVLCSVESYVMRNIIGAPEWDVIIQGSIVILGLIYSLKVPLYHAWTLSITGCLAFAVVQSLVLKGLGVFGMLSMEIGVDIKGIGAFIPQMLSQLTGIALSYMLYKLRLGFTFVTGPPYAQVRSIYAVRSLSFIFHFLAVLILAGGMVWVVRFGDRALDIIIFTGIPVLAGLIYLAYQEESKA